MYRYDSNCTSRTNSFDLGGTPHLVFEPEPLNEFESISTILASTFKAEPLEGYFWEQSTVPSLWNIDWTDAARTGGRLNIIDPVFGSDWTRSA